MKKKLIEVALPLEAINRESAREKSIRHGHPSTLHLWWARRPLAACRAVLWASLVDDPSADPDHFPTEADQEVERKRLFAILEELVLWENSNNETVLAAARAEILASTDGNPPPVLDPFCGGGSIPLEAQRLGLEPHASDLNPVAVLITKALIEIPPKFGGRPPVHPQEGKLNLEAWTGATGLAEDVRYYGESMRIEAEKRIGHLYPKAKLPKGGEATVIAWLWARTVTCPNPACGANMPLVRSFSLSTKKGKEASVDPVVDQATKTVRFEVRTGKGAVPEGTVNRRGARCIVCSSPVPLDYVRAEGGAGRMGARLMAIVAEGDRGRAYLSPDPVHEKTALSASPGWAPESDLPAQALGFRIQAYGMTRHRDLFTDRQLVALTTLSDLVAEVRERVLIDAGAAGMLNDGARIDAGGTSGPAYADAIAVYIALAVDRIAMTGNSLVRWNPVGEKAQHAFGRQALPMVWDFAEPNFFGTSTGAIGVAIELAADPLAYLPASVAAKTHQLDATSAVNGVSGPMVCTDPPYYDNIGYADLSDFFYVWLRHSLSGVYPDLFATLLTPKREELVATPYRFGGDRSKAEEHFERGLSEAFERIQAAAHRDYPTTVFYAFKQAEDDDAAGVASTGWETMLTALLRSGFAITGTWPMRTEMRTRQRAQGSNALASSIVLVCRTRPTSAPLATRMDFIAAIRTELPQALRRLQHGNIAPVDLAQASIGPGMGVFSRYSRVVEADGSEMTVRSALALINQALDEILAEQEWDFDPETRWAVAWFEQFGMNEGPFGQANVLATAKNTAANAMVEAGIISSRSGKVRLLDRSELFAGWDPTTDQHVTVWEVTQNLVKALDQSERAAADLLRKIGGLGETARELSYRLYVICERKGWSKDALAYNGLVVAWPEIVRLASSESAPTQQTLA